MGLDVSAYRKIEPVECGRYDECYPAHINLHVTGDFPVHADGLRSGCYVGETFDGPLPSRSYSGYNRWREWLSRAALGVTPEEVWDDPEQFAGRPFCELINFSDCEGVIGTQTSAKLAKDFKDHREIIKDADAFDAQTFLEFLTAFEFASDNGAVVFH